MINMRYKQMGRYQRPNRHHRHFNVGYSCATAMGAALAIHSHWNDRFLPGGIIELKFYK
jgi:hypothetical protein